VLTVALTGLVSRLGDTGLGERRGGRGLLEIKGLDMLALDKLVLGRGTIVATVMALVSMRPVTFAHWFPAAGKS